MNIRLAQQVDIAAIASIYAETFNAVTEDNWDLESAGKYIEYCYRRRPDLFFVAMEEGKIIGGVCGEIHPWVRCDSLGEIELFVAVSYREKGIGKELLKKIIQSAIDIYHIQDFNFIADASKEFPYSWYKKLGMNDSTWVFMSGNPQEVLNNL